MDFDALFEPLEIGDVTIKNRIALAPMNMGYTGPYGFPSQESLAWYATRARGGFGLIITEATVINPHRWRGSDALNTLLFTNQRYHRFLSEIVELIHSYDKTKVFLQMSPGWGRQGHAAPESPDVPAGGPSPIPMRIDQRCYSKGMEKQVKRMVPGIEDVLRGIGYDGFDHIRRLNDEEYAEYDKRMVNLIMAFIPHMRNYLRSEVPRELEKSEIVDLEDRMAERAFQAMTLGFDGIEIHSPHGYLIHSFLSSRSNTREDEYGGSIENRARFLVNIIRKVRAVIGPDKPLGARFSGEELMPEGVTFDEARQFAGMAAEAGVNFIDISRGSYENPGAFFPGEEDVFTQYAPGFKEASGGLPVITPGFITPEAARRAVTEKGTDIVSLGRQAIADPYWPAKVKAGRFDDIVKCTRCDQCVINLQEARWARCIVNPTAGFEKFFPELWLPGSSLETKAKKFMAKLDGLPKI